jgi:hypothetical protein
MNLLTLSSSLLPIHILLDVCPFLQKARIFVPPANISMFYLVVVVVFKL